MRFWGEMAMNPYNSSTIRINFISIIVIVFLSKKEIWRDIAETQYSFMSYQKKLELVIQVMDKC